MTARRPVRGRRARLAAPTLVALLAALVARMTCGCAEDVELSRRFAAERARWHVDRREAVLRRGGLDDTERAELREAHLAIASRFGAGEGADTPPRDADVALRLRIAGSSALFAADLAAQDREPPDGLESEYERIERAYGFDPDLARRAAVARGWIRERRGDVDGALAIWGRLVEEVPPEGDDWRSAELADLDVHRVLVARASRGGPRAREMARTAVARLDARLAAASDPVARRGIARCLAEARCLADDWSDGLAELSALRDAAVSTDERAALSELLGEARELGGRERDGGRDLAEADYRDAVAQGNDVPAAAEARIRLGDRLVRTGRPVEGLGMLDDTLKLGARVLEGRRAEALVQKARCLVALGRWEDALPVLEAASGEPPDGPFPLVAAAAVHRRLRSFTRPATPGAAAALVSLAESIPPPPGPPPPPRTWVEEIRRERGVAEWKDAVRELRVVAARGDDPELARRARVAADRLDRERVGT